MGTIPTAHDWIAGDDATSAVMQTLTDCCHYALGRSTSGGSRKPLFNGQLTVAQSLTTAVEAALLLDTESSDYDNGHSTVTNTPRYVAATAGWYYALAVVQFASNATGYRQVSINANTSTGSVLSAQTVPAVSGQPTLVQASTPAFLNGTTDYLSVGALQNSGGALNVVTARFFVFFLSV